MKDICRETEDKTQSCKKSPFVPTSSWVRKGKTKISLFYNVFSTKGSSITPAVIATFCNSGKTFHILQKDLLK